MITLEEYHTRRQKLAHSLSEGSLALIASASEVLRNGDAHYRFRQDSDFYYLTGFNEPDAVLLIEASGNACLFCRPRNPVEEQWTGRRLGQDGARLLPGITEAWPISEFSSRLPEFLTGKTAVYYATGGHSVLHDELVKALQSLKGQVRKGITVPDSFHDIDPLISHFRLYKSEAETALMRRAATVSVAAHQRAMAACSGLLYEYQLEAELIHELTRQGCRNFAYDPIVGSGANACILHYTENNARLVQGELVLVDAGGECDNYAADITRTFPVNGRFSDAQRAVYELVLRAQKAGIAEVKPGMPWPRVQEVIVRVLTEGLCDLGLLQGNLDDLVESHACKTFYPHNSGHWLGLDVHDSGSYKVDGEWRLLEPGMVLTVEPGLYITPESGVDERWWNIGVRIEDDILVTPDGPENLSGALPVEVSEIEALMRG